MKDDSGSYAVFTEQGSSASQMTTARVLDVIARLLGCAGQASDAPVKMKDAPTLLKLPKSESGYVYHGANGQMIGRILKNQWFLWRRICTDTSLLDIASGKTVRKGSV